jgi:hypothetical protein
LAKPRLSRENAVLLACNILLLEKMDLKDWALRRMSVNVNRMKAILAGARWEKGDVKAKERLARALEELEQVISEKDATRVDAAHTHLDEALGELRERVFGV